GCWHDTSSPFADTTNDKRGHPYFWYTAPAPGSNPATCAAESAAGTVQSDPTCSNHMWVAWSADGGSTWDGGGGIVPGSAATAYEVDSGNAVQTDLFPTITAGKPGEVDVSWLRTN